jgi:hypothetical protein
VMGLLLVPGLATAQDFALMDECVDG